MHPDAKNDWDKDYPVANFGLDHDIKVSQANEHAAGEFNPLKLVPTDFDAEFHLGYRGDRWSAHWDALDKAEKEAAF